MSMNYKKQENVDNFVSASISKFPGHNHPKYLKSYFKAMEYVPVHKVNYLHCDNN